MSMSQGPTVILVKLGSRGCSISSDMVSEANPVPRNYSPAPHTPQQPKKQTVKHENCGKRSRVFVHTGSHVHKNTHHAMCTHIRPEGQVQHTWLISRKESVPHCAPYAAVRSRCRTRKPARDSALDRRQQEQEIRVFFITHKHFDHPHCIFAHTHTCRHARIHTHTHTLIGYRKKFACVPIPPPTKTTRIMGYNLFLGQGENTKPLCPVSSHIHRTHPCLITTSTCTASSMTQETHHTDYSQHTHTPSSTTTTHSKERALQEPKAAMRIK